jgi:hypothetical protein
MLFEKELLSGPEVVLGRDDRLCPLAASPPAGDVRRYRLTKGKMLPKETRKKVKGAFCGG